MQKRTSKIPYLCNVSSLPLLDSEPWVSSHGICSNHPVVKDDGLLAVFLAEPSFEQWRKHSSISLEEESTSKRVDRVEEMSIPSDLEDKLGFVSDLSFTRPSLFLIPNFFSWQQRAGEDKPFDRSMAEDRDSCRTYHQEARGRSGTNSSSPPAHISADSLHVPPLLLLSFPRFHRFP